jgi:GT2 family glycosyltransferase
VDNASDDGTRNALEQLASRDDRLEVVCAEHNLGWAAGTLAGLERLRPSDTHVLLLNSDTIVGPGWLSKLLWHLERRPDSSFVIPNENPTLDGAARRRARGDATAAITPGTAPVSAPPPDLATVLRTSAEVERRFHRKSQVTAPSGFCLLFSVADLPLVKEYLRDFERYHAGEIDWSAWWSKTGKSCREALDNYVFHARGGSGGYYAYDRDNTP